MSYALHSLICFCIPRETRFSVSRQFQYSLSLRRSRKRRERTERRAFILAPNITNRPFFFLRGTFTAINIGGLYKRFFAQIAKCSKERRAPSNLSRVFRFPAKCPNPSIYPRPPFFRGVMFRTPTSASSLSARSAITHRLPLARAARNIQKPVKSDTIRHPRYDPTVFSRTALALRAASWFPTALNQPTCPQIHPPQGTGRGRREPRRENPVRRKNNLSSGREESGDFSSGDRARRISDPGGVGYRMQFKRR